MYRQLIYNIFFSNNAKPVWQFYHVFVRYDKLDIPDKSMGIIKPDGSVQGSINMCGQYITINKAFMKLHHK